MAPLLLCPALSASISMPGSKSSWVTSKRLRMSASGDRWEEGHLVIGGDRALHPGIILIDRRHQAGGGKRFGMGRAAAGQPVFQSADGVYLGRRGHGLLADADLPAQSGEVDDIHGTGPCIC